MSDVVPCIKCSQPIPNGAPRVVWGVESLAHLCSDCLARTLERVLQQKGVPMPPGSLSLRIQRPA